MPVFDRKCTTCDWLTDFALEPVTDPHPPCPDCGGETERYMAGHGPMVIPDTYATPVVDSVMTNKRQIHYSRSERKARMKNNRLREFERWTSGNESDKSCLMPRWGGMSQSILDGWREFFNRDNSAKPQEPAQIVAPTPEEVTEHGKSLDDAPIESELVL